MHRIGPAWICAFALSLAALTGHAAETTPKGDRGECWKASFAQQSSGEVREKNSRGGPYGYIYSYEGDFKWVGEPKVVPANIEYVFCFASNMDEGGVLIAGDKEIALGRVGSHKLPPLLHESANYSYSSTRDHYDFPTLYGSFHTPGKPDSSLELQLDRVRRAATLVTRTQAGKTQMAALMEGPASPVER